MKIEGKFTIGVFIYLSIAFDTSGHEILLRKLNRIGISGIPLALFKSFSDRRKQFVSVSNHNPSYQTINCGVPQVSILDHYYSCKRYDKLLQNRKLYLFFADYTNIFLFAQ